MNARTDALHPPAGLLEQLQPYRHLWPPAPLGSDSAWRIDTAGEYYHRELPERKEDIALDSRWPAFFPAPICIVTTTDGKRSAMEREVGASIVNRFPYVVALSICRQSLSSRHHPRATFMDILEQGGVASLQFLAPGKDLDDALGAIASSPDSLTSQRIEACGLRARSGVTNNAPILAPAYLVYEAKLVRPQKDFEGRRIYDSPWVDVGSHRIYFLEINAIQLQHDIATGRGQIRWRALPAWSALNNTAPVDRPVRGEADARYQKGYNPEYSFPAADTIAFEFDELADGMAVKHLPPLPEDQIEVDNDRARWPCFFPSSCGLITTWAEDGTPNLMPCGSTTVVSRQPFTIAPCVSYASINERYAARKSLELIRKSGRFGCSVPYISSSVVDGIKYAGNNSLANDQHKVNNSGFTIGPSDYGPVIREAPIHFDCEVTGEILLGTHVMFLGEAKRIRVRADVSPDNPLEWCPWAGVTANPLV
ncbi:flavin reductase [Methylibium sp.]|uniref:flavin reductase n=1 Tax=Methylibium sp. TaxID=2067992 RepID=UPI0017CAE1D0|nr:flavin reductase [Methylibium sp.]MBA3589998.1 flavin reductase [Methylibium sp.]